MKSAAAIILSGVMFLIPVQSTAFFEELLDGIGSLRGDVSGGLSQEKVIAGLKEALKVGSHNAVNRTGARDGFLKDDAIKIVMPAQLQKLDQALRLVGYGPELDELVVSMNRGAERATALAQPIFIDAIKSMTIDDAKGILERGDTAATDYFQDKTTDKLSATFRPQVQAALNQVGVTKQYRELVGKYESMPFVNSLAFDIDQYVVDHTLKGLFHVMAVEERKIRTDPGARVTDLLKDVFGPRN